MRLTTPLITASLLAVFASSSFAVEAEQASTWITPTLQNRAAVKFETARARHYGQLSQHEASFAVIAEGPALPRAQVVAEAREAMRLGLLHTSEAQTPSATQSELAQIRQAGLSALNANNRIAGK